MTRIVTGEARSELREEIVLLESLDADLLKARWTAVYGTEAPPRFSRDLLTRAVAYRIQESVLGGLKPATRRLLERVARDARGRRPTRVAPITKLSAGTVLLREWSGHQHQVTVLENSLMFRGKHYRSLSEIARLITGSHWSGPAFFGIVPRRQGALNGVR